MEANILPVERYHVETLIWTGPAWGSTTYGMGLWGRSYLRVGMEWLPAEPDRMVCQREDTGSPRREPYCGRIHIWDHPKGIKPYGHLAQYRGWPETLTLILGLTAPPSLTAGGAGGSPPGFAVRGTSRRRKKALASPGEGEWHSKHDTGQLFPPITCYPTHGKKLAQRGDCKVLGRCSGLPSLQLYKCLPERHHEPTHRRRQHSVWSEPSPPGGTACLGIGTPR